MEVMFADVGNGHDRRPFILNEEMVWLVEVNHFLRDVAIVRGRSASPHTSRTYAYHLVDWVSYCEEIGLDYLNAREIDIAKYRNILASVDSHHTKRPLRRETVNAKLGVICSLYKFLYRKKYISTLPFEYEEVVVAYSRDRDEMAHTRRSPNTVEANRLTYRTYDRQIEIPPNREIDRFIKYFKNRRDKLIAETMWLTGMRRFEVSRLSLHILPENLHTITRHVVAIEIKGKGGKWRAVKFPVKLLLEIDSYVKIDRKIAISKSKTKTDRIWLSSKGQPISPAAVNKFFETNAKRCKVKIKPHDLRHSYAVNRLDYLQERKLRSPLKVLQMELGHSHQQTTEKYLHLTDKMKTEIIDTYGNFIERMLGGKKS